MAVGAIKNACECKRLKHPMFKEIAWKHVCTNYGVYGNEIGREMSKKNNIVNERFKTNRSDINIMWNEWIKGANEVVLTYTVIVY